MFSAIILAAGKSTRMRGIQKQFSMLNGKMMIMYSVKAFLKAGATDIIIATNKNKIALLKELINNSKVQIIKGGNSRQASARIAFSYCDSKTKLVLIHDAARPFVSVKHIRKIMKIAIKTGAATLAISATDTVKLAQGNIVSKTLNRNKTFLIQTPQAFSKKLYAKALKLSCTAKNYTDDCQLIEKLNHPVFIVKGSKINFKITTQLDLVVANWLATKLNL